MSKPLSSNHTCFLSHDDRQREWTREFALQLTTLGIAPLWDEQVRIGDAWQSRLQQMLQSARLFVVLVTPESMASIWVRREIAVAFNASKTICPVILQDSPQPPVLRTLQSLSLIPYSSDAYRRLLLQLTELLDCHVHEDQIRKLRLPEPPAQVLPSPLIKSMISVIEPICHIELARRGLAATTPGLEPETLDEYETSALQASSYISIACQQPTATPLVIAQQLLNDWRRRPKAFDPSAVQSALEVLNRYLLPKVESEPTDGLALGYVNWLKTNTTYLHGGALTVTISPAVELERIYIQQHGTYTYESSRDDQMEPLTLRRDVLLVNAVEDSVNLGRRGVVFTGPAGAGKTTTLRYLAGCILRKDPRIAEALHAYLPVIISLRNVPARRPSLHEAIVECLRTAGLPKAELESLPERIKTGLCIVMLDGLDEVPTKPAREATVRWIHVNVAKYPRVVFVVTCRDHVFREFKESFAKSFLRVDIQALLQEDIGRFIRSWYGMLCEADRITSSLVPHDDIKREAERFVSAIGKHAELRRLAANPLMLQIMAIVNHGSGSLPQRRADLYRECVLVLAYRWDESRSLYLNVGLEDDTIQVLETVARWLHEAEGRTTAPQATIDSVIDAEMQEDSGLPINAPEIFNKVVDRGAIVQTTEHREVGFAHQMFQEYLVASSIVSHNQVRLLVRKLGGPWWREVINLALAHRRPRLFSEFITEMIRSGAFSRERRLLLDCVRAVEGTNRTVLPFVDVLLNGDQDFDARYNALLAIREIGVGVHAKRIREALQKEGGSRIRRLCGLLLGVGESSAQDDRADQTWKNPIDDMSYVLVPKGPFEMGAQDPLAILQETPVRKVYLSPYYIAVHPVTNAQYARFISETGYFVPFGRDAWNSWIDGRYPPGMAQHPVVYVTWYDAMRYCEWANCRLPTEAEWEKAARGIDGRVYSWGSNGHDYDLLMNYDRNVGLTTEVGLYPDGASPYGCLDMCGNVWEWCADWFSNIAYQGRNVKDPTGSWRGDRRVDRGGGWQMDLRRCRAAYRGGWPPASPDCDLGFRPAISASAIINSAHLKE